MINKLWNDEFGAVLSIELMFIVTILICGVIVGMTAIRDALVNELNDVAHAVGAANQSYNYTGVSKAKKNGDHARCSGAGFNDKGDDCDCKIIEYTDVCGKNDPSNGAKNENNNS